MGEGALFVLGGTTAAGKTGLALELAERLELALVSADAMMVYRGLDVGTAKPDPETLARFPHAGVDVRELDEEYSAADFVDEVRRARARSARVLVVGGTPFYLRALLNPLAELPPADPALRAELEALPDLHERLSILDPPTAARLHPHDRVRLVRALEVQALTGRPLSALHAEGARRPAPDATVGWLDRADLDERIAARLQLMADQGYVEEVARVLAEGADPACKPLRSFAYVHIVAHLRGEFDLDEAIRRTARDTRKLARRQRTWARSMGWAAEPPEAVAAHAIAFFEAAG